MVSWKRSSFTSKKIAVFQWNLLIIILFSQLKLDFTDDLAKSSSKVDVLCLVGNCYGRIEKCQGNEVCKKFLLCIAGCFDNERCNMGCTMQISGENKFVAEFFSCMREFGCVSFRKRPKCPRPPQNATLEFDLDSLSGQWWITKGWSKTYDCWDCQKLVFSPKTRTQTGHTWDFFHDMITDNKAKSSMTGFLKQQSLDSPAHLTTEYRVHGIGGTDDWHVLDSLPGYMLVYYCGKSEVSAEFQGGIVMTRTQEPVPLEVLERFNTRLMDLTGLSVYSFCQNNIMECPD